MIAGRTEVESLASWMHRFALDNGHTAPGKAFPTLKGQLTQMFSFGDFKGVRQDWPSRLAELSRLELHRIESMFWSELRVGHELHTQRVASRLTLGTADKTDMRQPVQHAVCPSCIGEMQGTFWLKSWRLATTVLCAGHKSMLLDRCPRCQGRFVIALCSYGPLDRCTRCGLRIDQMHAAPASQHALTASSELQTILAGDPTKPRSAVHTEHQRSNLRRLFELFERPRLALHLLGKWAVLQDDLAEILMRRASGTFDAAASKRHFGSWGISERATCSHSVVRVLNDSQARAC